jgi:hypothetical protein
LIQTPIRQQIGKKRPEGIRDPKNGRFVNNWNVMGAAKESQFHAAIAMGALYKPGK